MTIQLRPTDLPALRDQLIGFSQSDLGAQMREMDMQEQRIPPEEILANMQRGVASLRQADLFYVTSEMMDLAETAADSLPPFSLGANDPPSQHGLIWFSRPVVDIDESGRDLPCAAATWEVEGAAIRFTLCVDKDDIPFVFRNVRFQAIYRAFPQVFPMGSWLSATIDGTDLAIIDKPIGLGRRALAVLKTVWLLMRQPLAQVESAQFNRADRRRAEREQRELPPVRVINLRRPTGHGKAGDNGREWHHRWIVRGHWRMVRHGPGREQTRPVWISPHVKGPEGAPFLGGEKVYKV